MAIIVPTREQFKAFRDLPRDAPVNMLNALKYKPKATYDAPPPCGGSPNVSGEAAYERYKVEFLKYLHSRDGRMLWEGTHEVSLIGTHMEWDAYFVAYYPTAQDFIDMQFDDSYVASLPHRNAALEDSILMRCAPVSK
ncbi:MAG: DUF1330 domain-containing protein [Pseudomonadota bacterium]